MPAGEGVRELPKAQADGQAAVWSPELVREAFKQLVALIINQDHVAQGWLKFLITLQAGLVAALSYLFSTANSRPAWFSHVAELIPIIGIASAVFLTLVTIQERKWQCWYVHRANTLSDQIPNIFPDQYGGLGTVERQKLDYISKMVIILASALIIFWALLLVVQVL